MVFGFSEEERRERQADRVAKRIADRKRKAGQRRGLVEGAEEAGYEEGKEKAKTGSGGGFGATLAKLAGSSPKTVRSTRYVGHGKNRHRVTTVREQRGSGLMGHFEIGPRKGGDDFSLGFGGEGRSRREEGGFGLSTSEIDLGLGGMGSSKGKKRGIREEDLGL